MTTFDRYFRRCGEVSCFRSGAAQPDRVAVGVREDHDAHAGCDLPRRLSLHRTDVEADVGRGVGVRPSQDSAIDPLGGVDVGDGMTRLRWLRS